MRVVVMAVIAAAAILLLSGVYYFQSKKEGIIAGWNHSGSTIVTEFNVADLIVHLPVSLRVRKVELSQTMLSLDLNVSKSADAAVIYRDLYRITYYMNKHTSNVNHLFIRIIDYSSQTPSGKGLILLALDADRDQFKSLRTLSSNYNTQEMKSLLQSQFHLLFTKEGQQRYAD